MLFFSTLLFSLFITMALIPILRYYAGRMNCVDVPCERKVHIAPVPKVGGLAMAVGALVPMLLWAARDRMATGILVGSGIIVLFGFLDDIKELGYRAKFGAQLAAALVVVFIGGIKISCLGSLLPEGLLLPDWLAVPLTLLVIIGVTNAINLSDGLDGLAGGTMLLCFICIGFLAYRAENQVIVLLSVAVAGAIFGFLRFNTHPATVFMGDAGSQLLGFLAITMALTITQGSTPLSPLFPLLLLGLPILDTLTVMGQRVANGRSPFMADKNHLHHKLLRLNLYHTEAVFLIYVMQAGLVTAAFFLRFQSDLALLALYLVFCAGLLGIFAVAEKRSWRLERPGVFDRWIKVRLKFHIRDRRIVVKLSQVGMEMGFPLLVVGACLMPGKVSGLIAVIAGGIALALILVRLLKPAWTGTMLRGVIYFFMPLVVYLGEVQPAGWILPEAMLYYNLAFGLMTFLAIVTLRSTKRREGFKVSPLDFIILFVAAVVPNLPDASIQTFHLGMLAAKIIIFFFVFEVLVGELRGKLDRLGLAVVVSLIILAAMGGIGGRP